jgi:hypothetical protein
MRWPHRNKLSPALLIAASIVLIVGSSINLHAANVEPSEETTNIVVVVKEYDSGEPISRASITLQFTQPGGATRLGKSKKLSYNAKTDSQGRCKLQEINKGTIVLSVTAPEHQSYGRELPLDRDNQVYEVKLKKTQPLL